MHFNPKIHHRRSIRLKGYDYSQAGLYFVTICVQNGMYLLGDVVDGKMILNEYGQIAEKCWLEIPEHYPDAVLHNFVIMPNHVHGIIEITGVGANNYSPEYSENDFGAKDFGAKDFSPLRATDSANAHVGANNYSPKPQSPEPQSPKPQSPEQNSTAQHPNGTSRTIGAIVRGFKIGVTKQIGFPVWQRNYHEHIIRDRNAHAQIAEYIENNPAKWETDCYHTN